MESSFPVAFRSLILHQRDFVSLYNICPVYELVLSYMQRDNTRLILFRPYSISIPRALAMLRHKSCKIDHFTDKSEHQTVKDTSFYNNEYMKHIEDLPCIWLAV